MDKRTIKRVLKEIEELGGDPNKLVMVAPAKRGKVADRDELIRLIAKDRRESIAECKRMLSGYKVGVYVRAENLVSSYRLIEGDACLVSDHGDSHHSGEIVYFAPEDVVLKDAMFVDENVEGHTDERKAVEETVESSGRRRGRY